MKILVFADVHYYSGDMETAIFKKNKEAGTVRASHAGNSA